MRKAGPDPIPSYSRGPLCEYAIPASAGTVTVLLDDVDARARGLLPPLFSAPTDKADEPAAVLSTLRRVLTRKGRGFFDRDEYADVPADVADQWDSRSWRVSP